MSSSRRPCLFRRKDVTLKRRRKDPQNASGKKTFRQYRKGEKRHRGVRSYRMETLKTLSSSFVRGDGGGATESCIFPSTHASRFCVMSSDTEYGKVSPVIVLTVSHVDKLRRRHCVCAGVQCESHGPVTLDVVITDCFSCVIGDNTTSGWRLNASDGYTALRSRRSGGAGPCRGSSMLSTCVRLSYTSHSHSVVNNNASLLS